MSKALLETKINFISAVLGDIITYENGVSLFELTQILDRERARVLPSGFDCHIEYLCKEVLEEHEYPGLGAIGLLMELLNEAKDSLEEYALLERKREFLKNHAKCSVCLINFVPTRKGPICEECAGMLTDDL